MHGHAAADDLNRDGRAHTGWRALWARVATEPVWRFAWARLSGSSVIGGA